jgi:hypothetical protein
MSNTGSNSQFCVEQLFRHFALQLVLFCAFLTVLLNWYILSSGPGWLNELGSWIT